MGKTTNLYCKVFVDTDNSHNWLENIIANALEGRIERFHSIESEHLELDVVVNSEFDDEPREDPERGFLFYRYFLDIDPTPHASYDNYLESISILLDALWKKGCKCVAACDFEEELPKKRVH